MKQHDDDDDQTIDFEPDEAELEVEFEPDPILDEPSGGSLVAPVDLAAAIEAWDHDDGPTSSEEAAHIQSLKTLRRHPAPPDHPHAVLGVGVRELRPVDRIEGTHPAKTAGQSWLCDGGGTRRVSVVRQAA